MLDEQSGRQRCSAVVGLIVAAALILAGFGGCGSFNKPTPTPTKTPKIAPTDTPISPTSTMTPLPPTATPEPTQPPIALVTSTPTATSTPASIKVAPTFPPNVCPLTGLPVEDPAKLNRRPLNIKVSNAPAIVRPQSGLDKADLVFEHMAEARLTRFTAIFLSQDADKVGSVRSARLLDLELPAMFKSLFAYSGASAGVLQLLRNSDFADRIFTEGAPGFVRVPAPGKAYEHTLFTSTSPLWKLATERNLNQRQDLTGWVFSPQPPAGGQEARELEVVYSPGLASAEYRYDAGQGTYLRSVLGEPHVDEVTGRQLSAKNVVVWYAHHVETDIVEDSTGTKPYYSIQIQVWGQGPAKIFRDGRVYDVTWVRAKREDMVRFFDAAGNLFPFKPGNTWFQMVPLDFQITVRP